MMESAQYHPLRVIEEKHDSVPNYECEDCIGMMEHGCYCRSVGAIAPGGPLPEERKPRDV